jgi:hypothetical protein
MLQSEIRNASQKFIILKQIDQNGITQPKCICNWSQKYLPSRPTKIYVWYCGLHLCFVFGDSWFESQAGKKHRFSILFSVFPVKLQEIWFALGGLVVSVLATGPKVAGSNPAEDDGF